MGGLMIHGLRPGPLLFTEQADIVYGIFMAFFIANFFMMAFQWAGIKLFVKVLSVPRSMLIPVILLFCVIGSFGVSGNLFDVYLLLVFGVLGFFLNKYGYGTGAVSLYAGTTDLHKRLERAIAEFYGAEDAILFPCGYSANVGIISALCGPGDVVINDAANHASIFDGCRLSGADIKVYLHNNMRHLEKTLRALPEAKKGRLIITDGVFSMAGDLAPLGEIVALAARYGARVMVDDAHGLGIVGPTGRGTAEQCGVAGKIDLSAGVLSKSPGGLGGYCAGSAAVVQYLRFYARTYFFSTSLPAPVAAGLLEVFRLFTEDKAGRAQLWRNIDALRSGLQALGFDTGSSGSAVIPVIVGDELRLVALCNDLRERGVYTNIVTYPAVRRKECRLRLCVMSTLTPEDIARILALFAELGRKHGVIK